MKHTSILIPLTLAGLALMSFACAEDNEGNGLETALKNSDILVTPNSPKALLNSGTIHPNVDESSFKDPHDGSCLRRFNISNAWVFEGSDFLVIADELKTKRILECEDGSNQNYVSMRVERVFGEYPIQQDIEAKLSGNLFGLSGKHLVGLKKNNERFEIQNSIPIAFASKSVDSDCFSFFLSKKLSEIQSSYSEYQAQHLPSEAIGNDEENSRCQERQYEPPGSSDEGSLLDEEVMNDG